MRNDQLVAAGFESVADAFFTTLPSDGSSGGALSVWIDGKPAIELWAGAADSKTARPFAADTPSVIFSCTKGLASLLIAMLVERGALPSLDTPISEVWPEFGAFGKDRVSLGDVLAHRAGLSAPRADIAPGEALNSLFVADLLAAQEPLWAPGSSHNYHPVTHGALTAKIVHLATGRSIGSVFASDIAEPLGADAWIGLPAQQEHRVAQLVDDPAPEQAQPGPDDYWLGRAINLFGEFNAALFNEPRMHAAELPGVNGIASASGLARIWSASVTPTNGVRLIGDDTVDSLRALRSSGPHYFDVGPPPYQSWGGGVMVPSDWERYLSPSSFGHDGAGGQIAFADSDAKVGFAYITNQMGDYKRGQSITAALRRALG
jgi:CubicO group peptidase (beta-lactamase class C family)